MSTEENTENILGRLQKQRSNKLKFLIIIFSVIGIIILLALLISAYFYFKSPEKTLGIGANIESALLSADGKISYLKLTGGSLDKNITKIKFIFSDSDGNEHIYETNEGTQEIEVPFKKSFWDIILGIFGKAPEYQGTYNYEINSNEIGLDSFENINEVSVLFEYQTETGDVIETPVLDTQRTTNRTTTPSGSSGPSDGGTPTCTPTKTCADYAGQCSSSLNDGCSNSLDCSGSCGSGEYCNGTWQCVATPLCTHNDNCSSLSFPEIAICNNTPDNNLFTFDYAPENLSVCNLIAKTCTIPTQALTHTCNFSCGADCTVGSDCSDAECDSLDGCQENDYYDYSDVKNNCANCNCENNLCENYTVYFNDARCLFNCIEIKECNNYTDSENCTADLCDIENCEWNSSSGSCIVKQLAFDGWRVMPIRSQEEFNLGRIGGEGEQNMHGLARSLSNPNIIYASQDIAGPWKSINGGESWRKLIGKGLYVSYSYSIEVDPVNPDIVFIIVCSLWDGGANNAFEGLYLSIDGGDNWEHVLPLVLDAQDANYQAERRYQHNIAYDFSSRDSKGAKIWYAAFLNKGLYKSDDYGNKGSWVKVADLTAQGAIYEIEVNPSDGSVYIGTAQGLFKYTQSSGLQAFGNLPSGIVPSIEINLQDPNIVYATLQNSSNLTITGLYKSTDRGNTFSLLKQKAGSLPRVFINPGYPNTIYLLGSESWPDSGTIITHDGGQTWIHYVNSPWYPEPKIKVYYLPGVPETGYHAYLRGGSSGAVVPNPQDANEAVGFFNNGRFYKTTNGTVWTRDCDGFTGFAVWISSGFAFDKFNPNRFALFLCDVVMEMTKTGGDWFYRLANTTTGVDIRTAWRGQWLILASGATGSYSGSLQPVAGSETMVATIGDYPVGSEKVRVMHLENESSGWDLATYNKLIKAEHLDENKNFVSDIYSNVKTKDSNLSETIPIGHYVRATFEQNFTKYHSVNIYIDKIAPMTIEVYANGTLLGQVSNPWEKLYQIKLTNLTQEVNALDFKIVSDPVKFDYIYESKLYRMWFVAYHLNDPNIVYAGELISHDAGKTFQKIAWRKIGGGDFTGFNTIMGMCNSNPDTVYAIGGYGDTILRSDDKAETWYLYSKPGWKFTITDPIPKFTADPIDCNKVYTLYSDKDIAVFNGTTWKKLGVIDLVQKPAGLRLSVGQIAIDPRNNSIIYAGVGAAGVSNIWRSTDAGATWQDISYNLPRRGYNMAVNPHTGELFAGGGVGTWVFPPPYESSNLIYNKAHPMPSCYDGLQNGDEKGIDCGGSCEIICIESAQTLNPFVKSWNWLKSLLTGKTGNAILTGKTITGNAVNETGEDSKVPYIILSLLVAIILIIAVVIVKNKSSKKKYKKKGFRKNYKRIRKKIKRR